MTTTPSTQRCAGCSVSLFKEDGSLEELTEISELVAAGYGDRQTINRAIKSLGLGMQLAGKGKTKIRSRDVPLLMQPMVDI